MKRLSISEHACSFEHFCLSVDAQDVFAQIFRLVQVITCVTACHFKFFLLRYYQIRAGLKIPSRIPHRLFATIAGQTGKQVLEGCEMTGDGVGWRRRMCVGN